MTNAHRNHSQQWHLFLVTGLICPLPPTMANMANLQSDQPAHHSRGRTLPNIVLCMGDDHGWEETGYNGNPQLRTPVLDEMAATGLRLDHFFQ